MCCLSVAFLGLGFLRYPISVSFSFALTESVPRPIQSINFNVHDGASVVMSGCNPHPLTFSWGDLIGLNYYQDTLNQKK